MCANFTLWQIQHGGVATTFLFKDQTEAQTHKKNDDIDCYMNTVLACTDRFHFSMQILKQDYTFTTADNLHNQCVGDIFTALPSQVYYLS